MSTKNSSLSKQKAALPADSETDPDWSLSALDAYPNFKAVVGLLASATSLSKAKCVGVLLLAVVFVIVSSGNGKLCVDLAGISYPLLMSIRAVENCDGKAFPMWCSYWMAYVFATKIVDEGLYYFVSFVPFYQFFKALFLFWCFSPVTKGAQVIYDLVLLPAYSRLMGLDEEEEGRGGGAGTGTGTSQKKED